MTKNEAKALIWKYYDAVDWLHDPAYVKVWAAEAKTFLFNLDTAPRAEIPSVIFENGYVRGMEHLILESNSDLIYSQEQLIELAHAWRVLVDDFIRRVGQDPGGNNFETIR